MVYLVLPALFYMMYSLSRFFIKKFGVGIVTEFILVAITALVGATLALFLIDLPTFLLGGEKMVATAQINYSGIKDDFICDDISLWSVGAVNYPLESIDSIVKVDEYKYYGEVVVTYLPFTRYVLKATNVAGENVYNSNEMMYFFLILVAVYTLIPGKVKDFIVRCRYRRDI